MEGKQNVRSPIMILEDDCCGASDASFNFLGLAIESSLCEERAAAICEVVAVALRHVAQLLLDRVALGAGDGVHPR